MVSSSRINIPEHSEASARLDVQRRLSTSCPRRRNILTSEEGFIALQEYVKHTRDSHFAVVQNPNVVIEVYYGTDDHRVHPLLRVRYPIDVSWDELMSGGYVSVELFQGAAKDYFIFGNSGTWGRYVANDYASPSIEPPAGKPLNIMGFKENFSELFRKNFEEARRLEPYTTLELLLPASYKKPLGFLD